MTPTSLLLGPLYTDSFHLSLQTHTSTPKRHSSFSVCLLSIFFLDLIIDSKNPPPTFFFSSAFDETGVDNIQNRVANILLGNAIPKKLIGTTDSNFYVHYSEIATVEANWDLPTLGRRDVGANVFSFVAEKTHDEIRTLKNPPLDQTFLNESYPGPFNSVKVTSLPVPNTKLVVNGRRVLESIVKIWGSPELQRCTPYDGSVEVPSGMNPPVLPKGC